MRKRVLVHRSEELFVLVGVPAAEEHALLTAEATLRRGAPVSMRHTADRSIAATPLAIDGSLLTAGSVLVNAPDLQVLLAKSGR